MGKLIIFFLYPPHPLSRFGTIVLCHCRVALQSHCSCSDSSPPPTEGMRASVGTYTLGQSVRENSALIFYQGILGCSFFLPAGGAPQSEGGEATATYVLQARVLFTCIFFWGRSGILLLMYARVHTCACVCCVVSMQVCLP